VVRVGRGVVGAIEIVWDFFCRVCGTGLPGVGLVVAITLLAVVFDGWLWAVGLFCSYPSWVVYFCDSRVLAGYSDFGLQIARVVLFQMYCGLGGLDWCTPWNVLPYGCASPDR